ncbi:MAG: penicillin-binding protein 2 [Desulfobacterales bacterium]|jgi:cell division protein FtsI (penicillin-binding protein 3)|nr:penicillin-binding protein 2 [Desulfobacteraceae bacterium]MBT4363517.1 penicillin-binding protein 2 [Desulfobacteraceae bacterium]MBT7085257.1 penicillin-binding protein 2 [Desulfobacterales bacterium]MBT7696025.1 penicillin-binding protein 2 [Desulfobacterales bacterium]
MKRTEEKKIKIRIIIVGVIFTVFYLVIGAKAAYEQIYRGPTLSQKAADQYEKMYYASGKRGTIYDSKHKEMGVSIDSISIGAYPKKIKDKKDDSKTIAKYLDVNEKRLLKKLNSKKSFVWIKRHVTPKKAKNIKDLNFEGVDFIKEHTRVYPKKTIAAQLIGFSGIDGKGLEGIEFYYDSYLEGEDAEQVVIKDALGRGFDHEKRVSDYNGNNLILTIDSTIQYIAERALEKTVNDFGARSGMAIIMDPKTGAILAHAHYPFFNLNSFGKYDRGLWRNRAITDPFEPGSTMKTFLAAAAIESGYCSPDSIFQCNGEHNIEEELWEGAKEKQWKTLQQIIKFSDNNGAVKVAEMIGNKNLYNTLKDFGFGSKTGIDCPGETSGSLKSYLRWSKVEAGTISYGYGISVSAIQLITAVSAIANGGVLMKPYIVKAITDENGQFVSSFRPQRVRRVISETTAKTVRDIMATVTTSGGTGVGAAIEGFKVSGKTGTARKINKKGEYEKGKCIASFIGFAPGDNPELAVLVTVDEPQIKHSGGAVAAPAFKKIVSETFNYLTITPQIAAVRK